MLINALFDILYQVMWRWWIIGSDIVQVRMSSFIVIFHVHSSWWFLYYKVKINFSSYMSSCKILHNCHLHFFICFCFCPSLLVQLDFISKESAWSRKDSRYTEKDAAVVVRQMLKVAAECHLHGLVHRDMKPEVKYTTFIIIVMLFVYFLNLVLTCAFLICRTFFSSQPKRTPLWKPPILACQTSSNLVGMRIWWDVQYPICTLQSCYYKKKKRYLLCFL